MNLDDFYNLLLHPNKKVFDNYEIMYPLGKKIKLINDDTKEHTHTLHGCTHVITHFDF